MGRYRGYLRLGYPCFLEMVTKPINRLVVKIYNALLLESE